MASRERNRSAAAALAEAVRILKSGGLVAFPTETVYGLGADATSRRAVRQIFATKGRPSTNPLIVHVSSATMAKRFAAHWPPTAERLARKFWPGPLTLVLPKTDSIVADVTAGRDTVALRAPDHPLTLKLIRQFNGPIAGPSANRSTRVSPTTARHVRQELGDKIALVLDGGFCKVGIESTVLDLSGHKPRILRPGSITRRQIQAVIGPVDLFEGNVAAKIPAAGPGQSAVHYAPAAPMFRFETPQARTVAAWCAANPTQSAIILLIGTTAASKKIRARVTRAHHLIRMPSTATAYARKLYAALHSADAQKVSMIWVQMPPARPAWAAIRDRLIRASRDSAAQRHKHA